MPVVFPFENIYAQLPEQCFERVMPTPVKKPELIRFNHALATQLNIEVTDADDNELAQVFSGNLVPHNADTLAMAYSGHQFGNLNPQLGDGRAILLGDLYDSGDALKDIQLKGSGRTPFSRGGDGRSPLGPALREYILCEAMHALGVPTTRALAVVSSGEHVIRQQREPGAVFTRVASSHIRVGTFQYFAMRRDQAALKALADHVIDRHFSELKNRAESRNIYLLLFKSIVQKQAELIASWMNLGFIHGVMNTDNMTVSGETIDYGPCAFIDAFARKKVFSSIDQQGRYAYINQPAIGQWNLTRLAEAMLPLFMNDTDSEESEKQAIDDATQVLNDYVQMHQQAWEAGMAKKLGFRSVETGDRERFESLLDLLDESHLDFTLFFRRLSDCTPPGADTTHLFELFDSPDARSTDDLKNRLSDWIAQWQTALVERDDIAEAERLMKRTNPAIIPRNHQVQAAISAAEEGDYAPFEALLAALKSPYEQHAEYAAYEAPPLPAEQVFRTFCGT
jgi:uncharacterized protein YdiU (UPF0061 family)